MFIHMLTLIILGWVAKRKRHGINWALYVFHSNQEQMKKAKRLSFGTTKGICWGFFSSRRNDDYIDEDCVVFECFNVRVFL